SSPVCAAWDCLLPFQRRISVNVDPIRGSRRNVTPQTINLVICRCGLGRIAGIEPRPAPTVAPQRIARMAAIFSLHHDEPAFQAFGMADRARRLFSGCRLKHLLYEYRAVGKAPVLLIGGDGAGRDIDDVELLRSRALVGRYRPATQKLVGGAIGIGY